MVWNGMDGMETHIIVTKVLGNIVIVITIIYSVWHIPGYQIFIGHSVLMIHTL